MQYQLFPALTTDEYSSLRDDIAKRGVQVPIEYDEAGNVLDGHHRLKICQELGIKNYPSVIRVGWSEDEKTEHVLSLNLNRRHLTPEQRQVFHVNLRIKTGWSAPKIAEKTGYSEPTVRRDISTSSFDEVELPTRTIGKDGKSRPSKRSVPVKDAREKMRAFDALASLPADDLPNKAIDLKRIERLNREHQAEERRNSSEPAPEINTGNIQVFHGDFRTLDIAPGSVDLIFTDPPYPVEYLGLWRDLGITANKVLKDGCLLVAYSGQMYLPAVMNMLGESLNYVWMGILTISGQHNQVQKYKIRNQVKPLLIYSKGEYKPDVWLDDVVENEKMDKKYHDWGQGIYPAFYFIEKLTAPGGVVFDPFLGGGTTGEAAVMLGRSFIGCDVDKSAVTTSIERINNARRDV